MNRTYRWAKTTQFHSFILAGASILLLAYFTLLSPSSLEDDFMGFRVVHPKDLLNFLKNEAEPTIASIVPKYTTPAYSLRNFDLFITGDDEPRIKITAKKSNFYNNENLIHAKDAIVLMENGSIVTSKEIVFETVKSIVQFFGDVVLTMPDGALIRSDYMKVSLHPYLALLIPEDRAISGYKQDTTGKVEFKAFGMSYNDNGSKEIKLTSKVSVSIQGDHQIQSDKAVLNFASNRLVFQMDDQKNFDRQFVLTHQTNLEMKSRTLEIALKGSAIDHIVALNDVSIREKSFYSTCGKAVFYEKQNRIELSEFPQVYQQTDTITGDLIIYNRNDDSIEVKQSNAIYKR